MNLKGTGYTVTMKKGSFTAAQSAATSTNGSFDFTVTLSKERTDVAGSYAKITTNSINGSIAATPYTSPTPPTYDYFIITAGAGIGGFISPSGSASIREGQDRTFAITADSGYVISDVLVDGKSIGVVSSYTFENVREAHTIEAGFEMERVEIAHLVVTPPAFDGVQTGYLQPAAQAIIIENIGDIDASISKVEVDHPTAFTIGGSGDTIMAGQSVSTWTIQPNSGFAKGTYTAIITVTYDNNATATAQVSFTVLPGCLPRDSQQLWYRCKRLRQLCRGRNCFYQRRNEGGFVSLSSSVSVSGNMGRSMTYKIMPKKGYVISDVLVDGKR